MDAEILNQENDGIFIEIHDNNNNPNLLFEISILYDQYLELEDLLRILPKTWIELEKQRKLKLKIESVFVPTYEFVLKSGESYELRMIEKLQIMSNYKYMAQFCSIPTPVDDPVTYCVMDGKSLDNYFAHGGGGTQNNPYSLKCQAFMSTRCASNWDDKCEFASYNQESRYPNMLTKCESNPYGNLDQRITAGDILIANTAEKKYGKLTGDCYVEREPFDPLVLTSPYVEYLATNQCSPVSSSCQTVYDVDPATLDQDPVMNKILDKPHIAGQLLYRLFKQLKARNELSKIQNTRLGRFYRDYPKIYL